MRKKIFLQKGGQKSGHRFPVRAILLGALALLILVVVTPLITRQRVGKDASRKNASERGIVMKEIPKPPGSGAESDANRAAPSDAPGGLRNEMPPAIERKPVEGAPPQQQAQPGSATVETAAVQPSQPTGTPPGPNQGWIEVKPKGTPGPGQVPDAAPPAKVDQKAPVAPPPVQNLASVAPKAPAPPDVKAKAPSTATKKEKGAEAAKAKDKAAAVEKAKDAAKLTAPPGKIRYSVQVGLFKNRGNAEEMRRNLQKRGYEVVLKPSKHPNLGDVFVVQLKPVDDMGKASTQVEQIKHEEKVKPMVVKVTGDE